MVDERQGEVAEVRSAARERERLGRVLEGALGLVGEQPVDAGDAERQLVLRDVAGRAQRREAGLDQRRLGP